MSPGSPFRNLSKAYDDDFSVPTGRRGHQPDLDTFAEARELMHRRPEREPRSVVRLSIFRKIALSFVGVAVLLLAFVAYISFSSATVTVVPKSESVTDESTYTLTKDPSGEKSVPGYVLETVVDGEKSFVVTSTDQQVADANACGDVTIVNDQSKSQALVATTRLLTPDGVLFRITKGVTVPAGGETVVRACADQKGASGDVGPTTFTIPGLSASLQKLTYAKSDAAMEGGTVTTAVLAQSEVDDAIASFAKELEDQAVAKLADMVPVVEARNGHFAQSDVVKKDTDAKPGTVQSSFKLSLSLHVAAVFYDPMALSQAAAASLRKVAGPDRDLISVDQSTFSATLDRIDEVTKRATVKVKVSGLAGATDVANMIDKSKIVGLSEKDAERYLLSLPYVESVTFSFSPAWSTTLPRLKDHIDIKTAGGN